MNDDTQIVEPGGGGSAGQGPSKGARVAMPTKIVFFEKVQSLVVEEDVDEVRMKLEQEARSGCLVKLERRAPEGES
jgi:hypothetical protein